jgi:hypothetical protein
MLKFCLFLANIVVPFMLPVAWYWKVAAFFGIFYSVALVRAWFRVHANRRARSMSATRIASEVPLPSTKVAREY